MWIAICAFWVALIAALGFSALLNSPTVDEEEEL